MVSSAKRIISLELIKLLMSILSSINNRRPKQVPCSNIRKTDSDVEDHLW